VWYDLPVPGDSVRMKGDNVIQQVWLVKSVKTDSRGYWIQIHEEEDIWHDGLAFEVVDESR